MAKFKISFESNYNVGDVVIFKKCGNLVVGTIEGYYLEDHIVWYNIRVSPKFMYTYSNGGDIADFDIVGVISDDLKSKCLDAIKELE